MSKITILTDVEIDVNEALSVISIEQILKYYDPDSIMAMVIHTYGKSYILDHFSSRDLIEHAGVECQTCNSKLGKEVL